MNFATTVKIVLIHLIGFSTLRAQEGAVLLTDFSYSYGFPLADLQNRFGTHLCLGGGLSYKPAKSTLNYGLNFSYFFGSEVKEDVLRPFRSGFDGLLLGTDNYLAEFGLKERGFYLQANVGGVIHLFSQQIAHQGLKWKLGFGYIEHHIRFVDEARALPQFTDQYLQGLDRLCNGFAVIPFIGYEYLSRRGWLSFYTGIEPVLGFTANRRRLNYDTNQSELGISRFDMLINFKVGLYLPFYFNSDDESIEY